jgi:hypothetical protein
MDFYRVEMAASHLTHPVGAALQRAPVARIYLRQCPLCNDSPGRRCAGPPSLRLRRKEGLWVKMRSYILTSTLFPACGREGRRAKRSRGESTATGSKAEVKQWRCLRHTLYAHTAAGLRREAGIRCHR